VRRDRELDVEELLADAVDGKGEDAGAATDGAADEPPVQVEPTPVLERLPQ